jgi:predicted transcriptional regulator
MGIMGHMKRIHMYIRDDQAAKLKRLEEKTGARMSALIRQAVDLYLARQFRKKHR